MNKKTPKQPPQNKKTQYPIFYYQLKTKMEFWSL